MRTKQVQTILIHSFCVDETAGGCDIRRVKTSDSAPAVSCPIDALVCAGRLRATTGGKRALRAFLFGLAAALSFPPINFVPILWISFPALIFLLQGTTNARQAFVTGWCFGFGLLLFELYWIADSMFVDIAAFWWAVPLAVAGLPTLFALYNGAAAAIARKIGLNGYAGVMTFALCWFLADYARGTFFSGFPWNLEGYAWSDILPVMQITSVMGIYGLTLLTIVAASLAALFAENIKYRNIIGLSGLIVFGLCCVWGEWRLIEGRDEITPNVRLRLVQPNIGQTDKWVPEEREANFKKILALTSAPAEKPVTHVVWPETAATFFLTEDEEHRKAVGAEAPPGGAVLTGVVRRTVDENEKLHYYNSMVAVDDKARIVAGYDKHHLVPFGEYIPYRSFIPIKPLVNIGTDFSRGDGVESLRVQGLPPFSPLICYEVIFPGEVASYDDPPAFLLNITNDGWYGKTAGPYQHFASARVRAIEEGMPLVRAANTGISGIVDAYGRVTARLGLGKTGFVDAELPKPIPPTFFRRHGEESLWGIFAFLTLNIIFTYPRKRDKVKLSNKSSDF